MKIVAVSDVHGAWDKFDYPAGDVLIMAGDILPDASFSMDIRKNCEMQIPAELRRLNEFVGQLPYRHVLMIAGNHDWCFDFRKEQSLPIMTNIKYLEDSDIVIDGVRFYGSPWVPNLQGMAFYGETALRREKWAAIPENTHVLITHCPPYGHLDHHPNYGYLGCKELMKRVESLPELQAHVFGHIHCGHGRHTAGRVQYFNCAIMSEGYEVTNRPHVFEVTL